MKKTLIPILLLITILLSGCAESVPAQTDTEEAATASETVTETEKLTEAETTGYVTEEETEAPDEEGQIDMTLPRKSSVVSHELALDLLSMCFGGGERSTKEYVEDVGFEVLFTKHYDKKADDISHTSAFVVGKGRYKGRNVYIVVVRGTSNGEWYSNFDFIPSRNNDSQFSENFLLAAEDIYASVKDIFDEDENALFIVTGHSRGGATANLLGVILDGVYGSERVYCYTFATPNTVRGDEAKKTYTNIFNYINPNDVVTHLPLEAHGFCRAGTDFIIDDKKPNAAIDDLSKLVSIAPDIDSYYNKNYSLTSPGLSEDGMAPFDLMVGAVLTYAATGAPVLPAISEDSDLYPLVSYMESFTDTDSILKAHQPLTYVGLMIEKYDL